MAAEGVVARWWRGITDPDQADAYEALLRTTVLPGIHRIPGYRGAYLFRRVLGNGVEFATLTLWDSMDAVRAFAGSEHATAVVPPEARRLLREWDQTATHYGMIGTPADFLPGGGSVT
jgi:heme-degrading monooxygenase HmoA